MGHIAQLDQMVANLPEEARSRFERIYHLCVATGQMVPPEAMHGWIARYFGSVEAVLSQRIVKITNRVTLEGTLFNKLRADRPMQAPSESRDLEKTIQSAAGGPFCDPMTGTPADVFGRIQGKHALTASNVAKYDSWHAVIVFDEHHPLRFTANQLADYVDTAQRWSRAAHGADPEACYPLFIWNCLWRGGASILHGHAQMTLTRGMHYGKVESWRQAALNYREANGVNYFEELISTYRALDLAIDHGVATIFPSLTPFKEKETCIIAPTLDDDLKSALYLVMRTFVEQLGTRSFNLVLYQPPLSDTPEDWEGFPFIFRILDRGDLHSNASDMGAMELFAQSVVAADPFHVANVLRDAGTRSSEPA